MRFPTRRELVQDAGWHAGFKDLELGIGATYAFSKSWSVGMSGRYQRMLGDTADSPIADDWEDRDTFRLGALINDRF